MYFYAAKMSEVVDYDPSAMWKERPTQTWNYLHPLWMHITTIFNYLCCPHLQ
jgi:hypothetical protein